MQSPKLNPGFAKEIFYKFCTVLIMIIFIYYLNL